jgi:hypothetical protein
MQIQTLVKHFLTFKALTTLQVVILYQHYIGYKLGLTTPSLSQMTINNAFNSIYKLKSK